MIPGFLMATLNPGRKTRRRKRSGKLTAWQKAVKKHGGVMQAVRARSAGKKSRRKGRRRRNPFLTSAAAKMAFMPNAKRRKRRRLKRRSAVSRARARSRSRRASRRRPPMARVRRRRRRRTPPRGRGGRFLSRRRRSRRRRNPVVPVSWNPRRKRRRSRRRRNPLFLSRRGFSGRKHKGYRRLKMRRRHPRRWHNNPVVPVSWNPGRRRRRRHVSRRRRSYRRNAVLPFFAFNPGGGMNPLPAIMGRVKSLIDVRFWTETGIPAAGGFFGSKALGGIIHSQLIERFAGIGPTSSYYPYTKAVADTVAGAALAWAANRFASKKAGDAIWLGTVVNVAYSLIRQVMNQFAPGLAAQIGLSGLGNDLSDRMKEAVTARVRQSLGSYLTVNAGRNTVRPMGTYATVNNVRNDSYDPSPRGDLRDYDVANDETSL